MTNRVRPISKIKYKVSGSADSSAVNTLALSSIRETEGNDESTMEQPTCGAVLGLFVKNLAYSPYPHSKSTTF